MLIGLGDGKGLAKKQKQNAGWRGTTARGKANGSFGLQILSSFTRAS